ncbi:hypothetical protein Q7P35_004850 [Cladosporium inversicolor]
MLDSTYHLRCTDLRDKVYAILNIVSSGHQGIKADYTNTLPNLMNHILHNVHVHAKPYALHVVATQCSSLESVFGVSPGSIYEPTTTLWLRVQTLYIRFACQGCLVGRRRSSISYSRTCVHGVSSTAIARSLGWPAGNFPDNGTCMGRS